jgi:hypothetical protein
LDSSENEKTKQAGRSARVSPIDPTQHTLPTPGTWLGSAQADCCLHGRQQIGLSSAAPHVLTAFHTVHLSKSVFNFFADRPLPEGEPSIVVNVYGVSTRRVRLKSRIVGTLRTALTGHRAQTKAGSSCLVAAERSCRRFILPNPEDIGTTADRPPDNPKPNRSILGKELLA